MKTTALAVLLSLTPMMATADTEKSLTTKIANLEKAIRLQTLTTQAIRQENYDLACKAQREAQLATHAANVKDVRGAVDQQFAEICVISRQIANPNTPSWLKPAAGFEPAGMFFLEN